MSAQLKTKRTELQRLLSKRGLASRSEAARLVQSGKVRVNGRVERDPRVYISIKAKVEVEGVSLTPLSEDEILLIAFNKPRGVVTTRSDEKGRETVYDKLPEKYRHLKAVGRLDMASTGLLLFTNDNDLADKLMDPSSKIAKEYVVTVTGVPSPESLAAMRRGIRVESDLLKVSTVEVQKSSRKESRLIMTLHEGKNREIRRLCEATGHDVIKLKRIAIGSIELGDLPSGGTRHLDINEVRRLVGASSRG